MTHAWAAHPIYHLVRTLGGVTQTDVAWKRIRFAPLLAGVGTRRMEVVVPTPQGRIASSWLRTGETSVQVKLHLPGNVRADVCLPRLKAETVTGNNAWDIGS